MLSRFLATGLLCLTVISPALAVEPPSNEVSPNKTTAVEPQKPSPEADLAPVVEDLVTKTDVLADLASRLEEQVNHSG